MGIYNSSRTRVVPVFDRLHERDPTGTQWLPTLLELGDRVSGALPRPTRATLISDHPRTWGEFALSLDPPVGLLKYLVNSVTTKQVENSGDSGFVLQRRQALARKEPSCIEEALNAIQSAHPRRAWYLLEGPSRPDATLIMDEAVLVIEGKRTERTCTSQTKWMGTRSQLLRHMDAAMDAPSFRGKTIFGLLIVEGDGGSDAFTPSTHWIAESRAQVSPEMLASSLPHRSPAIRDSLANGVLGVCTWQAVCERCGVPWPPYEDGGTYRKRLP